VSGILDSLTFNILSNLFHILSTLVNNPLLLLLTSLFFISWLFSHSIGFLYFPDSVTGTLLLLCLSFNIFLYFSLNFCIFSSSFQNFFLNASSINLSLFCICFSSCGDQSTLVYQPHAGVAVSQLSLIHHLSSIAKASFSASIPSGS